MDEKRGGYLAGLFLQGREGTHLDALHAGLEKRERDHRVIDAWTD